MDACQPQGNCPRRQNASYLSAVVRLDGDTHQFISQNLVSTNAARLAGLSKSQCVTQTCQCCSDTSIGETDSYNEGVKQGNNFLPRWLNRGIIHCCLQSNKGGAVKETH